MITDSKSYHDILTHLRLRLPSRFPRPSLPSTTGIAIAPIRLRLKSFSIKHPSCSRSESPLSSSSSSSKKSLRSPRSSRFSRSSKSSHSKVAVEDESLESLMSYGLGSGPNGKTVSQVGCANITGGTGGTEGCTGAGLLTCSQVNILFFRNTASLLTILLYVVFSGQSTFNRFTKILTILIHYLVLSTLVLLWPLPTSTLPQTPARLPTPIRRLQVGAGMDNAEPPAAPLRLQVPPFLIVDGRIQE